MYKTTGVINLSNELFVKAITKFILGIILAGLLIFIPAGTTKYSNGWVLMATMFIPILFAGIIMMIKSPALLKKRLDLNETRTKQKVVVGLSALLFVAGFVIAGLNFRFKWSVLSDKIVVSAVIISLLAYIMYAVVLYQNKNLSRTIKTYENQKLIQTGLYGIIRHPMYFATIILFLSFPLILGSLYAFFVFLIYPIIIAIRIIDEEKLLEKELPEYSQYKKKVKYRLIPFIW